ncbi:MAG TPA: exodeoxyribonuclease VII large subunit [Longimicrobiales bacterium]|nr:exodeoxyribonuclease VII large subunit [Longimicrobiales bacterium]
MQESFEFGTGRAPSAPADGAAAESAVLTVAALNALVREVLEARVPPLWVEGEVSSWKRYASGHCYFCLRDGSAQVNAVMFRSDAQRLPMEPETGMHVRAFGSVSLYERRGDFQLIVRRIEATGDGGLWRLAFERLRSRLDAEGLLDPARRRPIPLYPRVVGIVTSPVGAALHDILNVVSRRAPWTRVLLSPARVQGEGASQDIARALRLLANAGVQPDVVIVGRGGGSTEDLWAFNEEPVARAIAECPVPVISAVGHEVDVTISDLVADLRAPTPSAAAEHAVPDGVALRQELRLHRTRLGRALRTYAASRRERITWARERLGDRIRRLAGRRRDELGLADERLRRHTHRIIEAKRALLARVAAKIDALSPLQSLARGYAVPLADDGRILRRRSEFAPGRPFRLRILDGSVPCRVESEGDRTDG